MEKPHRPRWLRWYVPECLGIAAVVVATLWFWPTGKKSELSPEEQKVVGRWRVQTDPPKGMKLVPRVYIYNFGPDRRLVSQLLAPGSDKELGPPSTLTWWVDGDRLYFKSASWSPFTRPTEYRMTWDGSDKIDLNYTSVSPGGYGPPVMTRQPSN